MRTIGFALGLLALGPTGCSSGTSTVSGTVTFQGQSVTSGSVIIYCADKQIVRGLLSKDGKYVIPNVPCGPAVVTVQAASRVPAGLRMKQNLPPMIDGPTQPTIESADPIRIVLPARYALPEESGLTIEVDGGQITYDVNLKP